MSLNFYILHHCRLNAVWIHWNEGNGIKQKLFNIILGYLFFKLSSLSTLPLCRLNVPLQTQTLYEFWLEEKSHSVLPRGKTLGREISLCTISLSISITKATFCKTYLKQGFYFWRHKRGKVQLLMNSMDIEKEQ